MALTRKVKKGSSNAKSGLMTIPQLRTAFDHLEKKTAHILKTKSKVTRVEEFQKEWKKLFKRPITESSAKEYLDFCESHGKHGKAQVGGAAPVDYTMGPGGPEPYGSFPSYLTSGFDVGVPRDSFSAQCGKEDATPILAPSFGSNLVGGKSRKAKKTRKQKGGMARLFQSTVPVGYGTEASTLLRGQLNPATAPSPVNNPIPGTTHIPIFTGNTAKTAW